MSGTTVAALASGWSRLIAKFGTYLEPEFALMEGKNHPARSIQGYPIVPTVRQARTTIFVSLRSKEGRL